MWYIDLGDAPPSVMTVLLALYGFYKGAKKMLNFVQAGGTAAKLLASLVGVAEVLHGDKPGAEKQLYVIEQFEAQLPAVLTAAGVTVPPMFLKVLTSTTFVNAVITAAVALANAAGEFQKLIAQ